MKSNTFYKNVDSNTMILRDHLAFDRTVLANWRTGFAFFRTSLVSMATGLTLVELFDQSTLLVVVGILAIVLSIIVFIVGLVTTTRFSKSLSRVYKKKTTQE